VQSLIPYGIKKDLLNVQHAAACSLEKVNLKV